MTPEHLCPMVSIGMPVYNGEKTIRKALDAVTSQTYENIEIIISDNASTDSTASICSKYAGKDSRIKYYAQPSNIDASNNFKFVLDKAEGKYFTWMAVDDWRSKEFIEANVKFLEAYPNYSASTSPNSFEGQLKSDNRLITFSMEGDIFDRFRSFFNNCWQSHGIFYSVTRTSILRECEAVGRHFFASDWVIDLHLARYGNVARISNGLSTFGTEGISRINPFTPFRNRPIDSIFPFYQFTKYVVDYSKTFTPIQKLQVFVWLFKLNIRTLYSIIRYKLSSHYELKT